MPKTHNPHVINKDRLLLLTDNSPPIPSVEDLFDLIFDKGK